MVRGPLGLSKRQEQTCECAHGSVINSELFNFISTKISYAADFMVYYSLTHSLLPHIEWVHGKLFHSIEPRTQTVKVGTDKRWEAWEAREATGKSIAQLVDLPRVQFEAVAELA